MKSLLILAAVLAPRLALGQGGVPPPPVANYNPVPLGSTAPTLPPGATPPAAGSTHDAASTVPLPGQPSGPNLENSIPLIPQSVTTTAGSHGHHKGAQGQRQAQADSSPHLFATFQTEQDIRVRVRMREAKTKALEDPKILAAYAAAQAATTDPTHRAGLKTYYNLLYARMAQLDPENADRIGVRRQSSLARLQYVRIDNPDDDSENQEDPNPSRPAGEAFGPNPPTNEGVSQ